MEWVALSLAAAVAALASIVAAALWAKSRAKDEKIESLLAIRDEVADELKRLLAEEQRLRREADEARAVAQTRLDEAERRIATFDALKAEMMQAANAALAGTAQQVSAQLLEHHRREAETQKTEGEQRVNQTTEKLTQRMEQLATVLTQLQGRVDTDGKSLDTVLRALSHPTGAGQQGEVILANTLRQFGLKEGRDWVRQWTTEDVESGARRRPDAIVFLPGEVVIVIDAKASKHVLADAGDTAGGSPGQKIAQTAAGQLKALGAKDYRGAVAEDCRRSGRPLLARIYSIMFLSTDAMVARLREAAPAIFHEADRLGIIIAGPTSLSCILHVAQTQIASARQIENHQNIADGAKALLDCVVTVLEHAERVGRGLKSSAESYEKLARSVNGTLLGRARRLEGFGLKPKRPLPQAMGAFQVLKGETLIDGEAEEVEALPARLAAGE